MVPAASISLLGVEMALLWIVVRRMPDPRRLPGGRRSIEAAGAAVALYCLWFSVLQSERLTTWRWRDSGPRDARNLSDYALKVEAFKGWRCNERIGRGVDAAAEYVVRHVPPGDTLLVLPDVTVLYGLTGRPSFRGAPFAFHLGQVPPPGPDYERFRSTFFSRPPKWIVLHLQTEIEWIDTGRVIEWLGLREYLAARYEPQWEGERFRILRLVAERGLERRGVEG